jgi:hypothetical protein
MVIRWIDGGLASAASTCRFPTRTHGFSAHIVQIHPAHDPPRRTAEPGIGLVAGMRKSRGRSLAEDDAGAVDQIRVITARSAEFIQLIGVVIFGEQPEENSPGPHEGRRLPIPAIFQQTPEGRYGAHPGLGTVPIPNSEDRIFPCPIAALRKSQSKRRRKRQWKTAIQFAVLAESCYVDDGSVLYSC